MDNLKNKISSLILKLALSGLPPSFQEYVISNFNNLNDNQIDFIIAVLDELASTENSYLTASEKYQQFYKSLSDEIKNKLKLEIEKINQELSQELS